VIKAGEEIVGYHEAGFLLHPGSPNHCVRLAKALPKGRRS
jgi:hypothetical protein